MLFKAFSTQLGTYAAVHSIGCVLGLVRFNLSICSQNRNNFFCSSHVCLLMTFSVCVTVHSFSVFVLGLIRFYQCIYSHCGICFFLCRYVYNILMTFSVCPQLFVYVCLSTAFLYLLLGLYVSISAFIHIVNLLFLMQKCVQYFDDFFCLSTAFLYMCLFITFLSETLFILQNQLLLQQVFEPFSFLSATSFTLQNQLLLQQVFEPFSVCLSVHTTGGRTQLALFVEQQSCNTCRRRSCVKSRLYDVASIGVLTHDVPS